MRRPLRHWSPTFICENLLWDSSFYRQSTPLTLSVWKVNAGRNGHRATVYPQSVKEFSQTWGGLPCICAPTVVLTDCESVSLKWNWALSTGIELWQPNWVSKGRVECWGQIKSNAKANEFSFKPKENNFRSCNSNSFFFSFFKRNYSSCPVQTLKIPIQILAAHFS